MVKLATIAVWGASIALVVVLWSYVQQPGQHGQTVARAELLPAEAADTPALTSDQWLQVYNLAKAAKDKAAFFELLKTAGIAPSSVLARSGALPAAEPRASTAAKTPAAAAPLVAARQDPLPTSVGTPAAAAGSEPAASAAAAGKVPHRELTREIAWKHARENVVIVTWTNFHFYDFVENWAAHLSNHRIQNYLIGAMDMETAVNLERRGYPWFAMFPAGQNDTGLGAQDFGWGSGKFHLMGRMKINLLKTFLGFGLDIMLCDSDTVWINDPTDYFNRFPAADILTSSDHMSPTMQIGDDGLEQPPAVHSAMNIGVMFFRHSQRTQDFVMQWVTNMDKDPQAWDQNVFNQLARSGFDNAKVHASNPRLFYGWDGKLVLGVLPVAAFASGHTFHVQHLPEVMEVKPYVVHQTFQYGGTKGKRHRLREAMLWYDAPEYYSEGPFVHVTLDYLPAPEHFEQLENFNMSEFHLANMEYQLLQLREAFAVAIALDRIIIMPKLMCYCDRYWGPVHKCRLPGADRLRLPFVCPLDHIFEPFHFDDKPGLGAGTFGLPIQFREHSFLENERTPDSVKSGFVTLRVEPSKPAGEIVKEDDFHIRIGANPRDTQIKSALRQFSHVKVIKMEFDQQPKVRPAKFFQEPFAPAEVQSAFLARMQHMPGFWCCREPWGPLGKGGTPYANMIMGQGIEHRGR